MHDTGLANRIRAKGVTVVEVAGWQTRGNGSGFTPIGAIHHHTAGSPNGTTPSLNTCIYGRPDVTGPLCSVLQSREADPSKDKAYVIAAGKGNHGGQGTWTGKSGTFNSNYESMGLEVEHVGTAPVDPNRHEISCRILAAFLEAPGSSRDPSMCCQHFEYATPAGRKVDFFNLSPRDPAWIRNRVGYWIGRTATTSQEDDLNENQNQWLIDCHKALVQAPDQYVPDAGKRIAKAVWEYMVQHYQADTSATAGKHLAAANAHAYQTLQLLTPESIAAAVPDDKIAEVIAALQARQ
jgi:hypothetical protein